MDAVIDSTFSILAVLGAVGIGYSYAKQLESDAIAGGAYPCHYPIMTPRSSPKICSETGKALVLPSRVVLQRFLAMIAGVSKNLRNDSEKGWVIKLPDAVPPAVYHSFT